MFSKLCNDHKVFAFFKYNQQNCLAIKPPTALRMSLSLAFIQPTMNQQNPITHDLAVTNAKFIWSKGNFKIIATVLVKICFCTVL